VDTGEARRRLAKVEAEFHRVVNAIAKVGLGPALESKLASLERQKRNLAADVRAADRSIQLPDMSAIRARWRAVVDDLGNLPKRASPSELAAARRSLQSLIGIVRVDRDGKGYADIGVGVPTFVVAGARCPSYTRGAFA
jgi:hypothetical protein